MKIRSNIYFLPLTAALFTATGCSAPSESGDGQPLDTIGEAHAPVNSGDSELPEPTVAHYDAHDMQQYALWEVPDATRVVWFVVGGGWTQTSIDDFFDPEDPQLSVALQAFLEHGISIGIIGYSNEGFPQSERAMGSLIDHSRRVLKYEEVDLLGRSAGANMSIYNGVIEQEADRRPDRVATIQQPLAMINFFDPDDPELDNLSSVWNHFWSSDGTIGGLSSTAQIYGSSAMWPMLVPNESGANTTRFCLVGAPTAFEAPIPTLEDLSVPLPVGVLGLEDTHSAISVSIQHTALSLGGYDSVYIDTHASGAIASKEAIAWLIAN